MKAEPKAYCEEFPVPDMQLMARDREEAYELVKECERMMLAYLNLTRKPHPIMEICMASWYLLTIDAMKYGYYYTPFDLHQVAGDQAFLDNLYTRNFEEWGWDIIGPGTEFWDITSLRIRLGLVFPVLRSLASHRTLTRKGQT